VVKDEAGFQHALGYMGSDPHFYFFGDMKAFHEWEGKRLG